MTIEDRQGLQELYENKNFKSLIRFGESIIDVWERENTVGSSEFETLRLSMEREFKIKGLTEFFHTWYKMAYDQTAELKGKNDGTTRTLES